MRNKSPYIWHTSLAFLLICSVLSSPPRLFSQTQPDGKGANVRAVNRLPSKEKRWALIIGVSNYEDGNITPLPGANNDAKALRDALHDYAGFDEKQIILLTTDESKERRPTKNNILRLLGNLSGTVPRDGLLLVAFSGHGIERQNQAFLLASDTPYNDNLRVLERTALSVQNDVKELIRDTGVGQVVILLDACRNDPASGRSDSDNPLTEAYMKGFSFDLRNKEVEAFATLYATSIGERAYEYAREGKGYFTWAFIEGLKGGAANERGEVTLGGLVRYVEKYVPQQVKIDLGSSRVQRPFSVIEGYKAEELVLGIAKNRPQPDTAPPPAPRPGEQSYWLEMENRNTIATYEKYLSEYPDGEFAKVAQLRLAKLKWESFRPLARKLLKYESVRRFSEGLAEVYILPEGDFAFIDRAGNQVFKVEDRLTSSFAEGLARITSNAGDNSKAGYIDKTGKEVIPLQYDILSGDFSEGLAAVRLNGKYGYIDKAGSLAIPFKYGCGFCGFSEGLAAVTLADTRSYGFIDKAEKVVIPFKYDFAWAFSGGLAAVELGELKGFVDKSGREVIPIKYESTARFTEGLAAVKLNGKWGFVDATGGVVIPLKYDYADEFSEGLAIVELNNKFGFIDRTGKVVVPFKYDDYSWFKDGLAEVKINDRTASKVGLVDKTGREVAPPKYDEVWCEAFVAEGFIGVMLDGRKGFVDVYGNEYFDF